MNTYRVRRIPFTAADAEVKHKCDKHRGKDYIQSCCNKELWLTVVTGTVKQSGKSYFSCVSHMSECKFKNNITLYCCSASMCDILTNNVKETCMFCLEILSNNY